MLTLGDIAQRLGFELHGDPSLPIEGVCGISDDLPRHLSFVGRPKHARAARDSAIPAFIVSPGGLIEGKSCLVHAEPEYACALVAALFLPSQYSQDTAIHPTAVIDPRATLDADVRIGPYVVIGRDARIGARSVVHASAVLMDRVVLGEDCVIHPHVTVREDCVLGHRVVVQPGAVIGGDGYGFVMHERRHHKIPQLGNVVIADDVEIGANATIDRGRFTATRVGRGSKIDNLVMIAHNVQIGEDCLLVSQTGISGSTKLGDRVVLAGQVGVGGHVEICSDVTVLGKSVIAKHVLHPGTYAGIPIRPFAQWKKTIAWLHTQAKQAGEDAS
ncbi:MAG TPA: UDP-3-O-(3-hydroxymyristoyl)glucosamine N-acyltransferase [Gammaproteobacteria bacterium]|nr:UDP-3-O-(3-hydroxymyristoyl)glucosamine N-acyltransferase [Gammaproteobacteria bacterium]